MLGIYTPHTPHRGKGFPGVSNIILLPLPLHTPALYPWGFPYTCHSLAKRRVWECCWHHMLLLQRVTTIQKSSVRKRTWRLYYCGSWGGIESLKSTIEQMVHPVFLTCKLLWLQTIKIIVNSRVSQRGCFQSRVQGSGWRKLCLLGNKD